MKIIDLHCDTLYKFYEDNNYSLNENNGHITDSSLQKSEYLGQCFAIYTPQEIKGENALTFFENQYNKFFNIINSSKFLSTNDSNKITAYLTVENGELLNNKLERINVLIEKNVKILGLVHNSENCLGFSHSKEDRKADKPLKQFGKDVVVAINNTKIKIDVSHLNLGGFSDVATLSKKPFIASHSACREITEHSRNLYDFQIKAIANSGGVLGVPFYSFFLNGTNKTNINDIIIHLEHLINVGGEDVAAIGTDFDGMECELPFQNAGDMQLLSNAIIDKFGINLAEKICYKNALRILE